MSLSRPARPFFHPADAGMSTNNVMGTMCRMTTFYANVEWAANPNDSYAGQMYVEQLEPWRVTKTQSIILIHGDFHGGDIWHTKPDGEPGWAAYFLNMGFRVFVVDLPGTGRSTFFTRMDYASRDLDRSAESLDVRRVERELTAPEKAPLIEGLPAWPTAHLHTQWPGSGLRGDPIFERYMASQKTLTLRKIEREALSQIAVSNLIKQVGTCILVGQGAGCTVAWLAADVVPTLVTDIVAIEPSGPPCGRACVQTPDGRVYSPYMRYDPNIRKYGLSSIPLTYDPPAKTPVGPLYQALDVESRQLRDNTGSHLVQKAIPQLVIRNMKLGQEKVRQLVNLKQVRHLVVSGHASAHSLFDWATVLFMRQAGVAVDFYELSKHMIFGNGHLMFLEKNSDQIASVVCDWLDVSDTQQRQTAQAIQDHNARNMRANEIHASQPNPQLAPVVRNGPNTPPQHEPTQQMARPQDTSMIHMPQPTGVALPSAGNHTQAQTASSGLISPPYYNAPEMVPHGRPVTLDLGTPFTAQSGPPNPKPTRRGRQTRQRSAEGDGGLPTPKRRRQTPATNGSQNEVPQMAPSPQENIMPSVVPTTSVTSEDGIFVPVGGQNLTNGAILDMATVRIPENLTVDLSQISEEDMQAFLDWATGNTVAPVHPNPVVDAPPLTDAYLMAANGVQQEEQQQQQQQLTGQQNFETGLYANPLPSPEPLILDSATWPLFDFPDAGTNGIGSNSEQATLPLDLTQAFPPLMNDAAAIQPQQLPQLTRVFPLVDNVVVQLQRLEHAYVTQAPVNNAAVQLQQPQLTQVLPPVNNAAAAAVQTPPAQPTQFPPTVTNDVERPEHVRMGDIGPDFAFQFPQGYQHVHLPALTTPVDELLDYFPSPEPSIFREVANLDALNDTIAPALD